MPQFRLQGSKLLAVTVNNESFRALTGSMVAYEGQLNFKKQSFGGEGVLKAMKRKVTGESLSLMECSGSGICYVAIEAQEVTIVNLQGQSMWVEASSLLALDGTIQTNVEMLGLQQAVQSGNGLFTTRLDGMGQVAFVSDGPAIALRVSQGMPVVVDPQAYVAHVGQMQSQMQASLGGARGAMSTMLGGGSGELFQQHFNGNGMVYVQPSERSGLGGDL